MTFAIYGIGTSTPEPTMSQVEAAELAQVVIGRSERQRRMLSMLYRMAGVENRSTVLPHRTALQWMPENADGEVAVEVEAIDGPTTAERMQFYSQYAPELAIEAAQKALDDAKLQPAEITHLVTVTCTGFDAPGVDIALIDRLGLRPTTERVQVGFMGCHGAINGLRVVRAIAESDPSARVLMVAVELCSLHYRFRWEPERLVANALFGDGAAAIIGWNDPQAASNAWHVAATGSCLIPNSQDAMSWRIGDHGFEMSLDARVPDLITQNVRPWLVDWLAKHDLKLSDVASWAIHPGGPRILGAIEEALGLQPSDTEISRDVLRQHGNMSSPTVLFILDRLRLSGAPRPCVAIGFGPGLMAEAALFT